MAGCHHFNLLYTSFPSHFPSATAPLNCSTGDVRLVGGEADGLVEMYLGGQWTVDYFFLSNIKIGPGDEADLAHTQHSAYSYALPATYITTYSSFRDNTNDHLWLKRVASVTSLQNEISHDHTHTQKKNSPSEIFHAMRYIQVRTYCDTMLEK